MSLFNPRGLLGLVGTMLALIALYLLLEKASGATSILGALASGSLGVFGVLQGRNVSSNGTSVSGGVA
ncbi:MAG TPA: hypothetical protein VFP61_07595 [Acidimicrobiales bacterium]|nr:hypothetical protein [Acidimicrobiales bacterium]